MVEALMRRAMMGSMVDPRASANRPRGSRAADAEAATDATRAEETGAASFPASDPPAVWTWEVEGLAGQGAVRGPDPDRG